MRSIDYINYFKFFKKNICKLFFITVIISSIYYIYLYNNNIIEPNSKINKTCDNIAYTYDGWYKYISGIKKDKIEEDLDDSRMIKAATGGGMYDFGRLKKMGVLGNKNNIFGSSIHSLYEDSKSRNSEAKEDERTHIQRGQKLEDLDNSTEYVTDVIDDYCVDNNTTLKGRAGIWKLNRVKDAINI
tara:strand:- start:97 stop:654 length:558 start_codon:yes stop_codon:yes gene_type:complete